MDSRKPEHEDLKKERLKSTFNPLELTYLLDGGREKTKIRRELESKFFSDPDLKDPVPIDFLSHKEKYEETIRKTCILYRKFVELKKSEDEFSTFRERAAMAITGTILKDGNPFGLNTVMFAPALRRQATPEQQKKWLKRALDFKILGTYAQTELGHGTYIRGLETTAHYHPETQEFVINSPTLSSYKWWPGGMGHTANHALVAAQLYTQGVHRGVHLFIVQLRDEETHEPMPGIKIGEIGTKLGMHTINNGFLAFQNVHIPRDQMLMKNAKVLEDGSYVKSPSDKLVYGAMMYVRVVMLQMCAYQLGLAATIAIRYSAVRRQSEMKPGEPEPQILDYRTQQYKLFPSLATSFAFRFTANWLWNLYNEVNVELEKGTLGRLPELHALSCCLKAVCTYETAKGVETCRLACGGHGYMTCSNFNTIYGVATAGCTYEGENTVMLLQTARYLLKTWQQAKEGVALPPTVAYLSRAVTGSTGLKSWQNTTESIVTAFQQVAASKVKNCADSMAKRMEMGISPPDAWNMTSIELAQCAEAHARAFIVEKCVSTIEGVRNVSVALKSIMTQLCELYAVYTLLNNKGDFLMFSSVTSSDIASIQQWMEMLLLELRPNAVGIVDGFDFHDTALSSTLGAWDGQVYERLFEAASQSPLNKESVNQSFHKYLKPFLKSSM